MHPHHSAGLLIDEAPKILFEVHGGRRFSVFHMLSMRILRDDDVVAGIVGSFRFEYSPAFPHLKRTLEDWLVEFAG
jgi:hypothetical protein